MAGVEKRIFTASLGSAMNNPSNPVVRYVSSKSKRYADLLSIEADLRSTIDICRHMIASLENPESDPVLIDALSVASLVRYARCFKTGNRHMLNPEQIAHLPGDPLGVHEYYKNQRDKLIAHSVNAFEETRIGLALSDPKTGPKAVLGVAQLSARFIAHDRHGVEQLATLAREFLKSVETEVEKLTAEILAEAETLPIEELYKLEPLQFITPSPQHAGKGRK